MREREVNSMKKVMEEEKKMHRKSSDREYLLQRELGQLRSMIAKWESEEEERERWLRDRHRQRRADDEVRKRVRIEEERNREG